MRGILKMHYPLWFTVRVSVLQSEPPTRGFIYLILTRLDINKLYFTISMSPTHSVNSSTLCSTVHCRMKMSIPLPRF